MNPLTRRRVARRRLVAEWAARANRWFHGDATALEFTPARANGALADGATGESRTRRLPFELLDAPAAGPVDLPRSNGNGVEAAASADPAVSADRPVPVEPVRPPSPSEPPSPLDGTGAGEADFNLGLAASRRGRWRDAVTHLRRAIGLDGGRAAAYFYLGEALNHVDDLPGALQAYQRSVELLPSNPKALYGMGIVLDRMNRPDDAAPLYRRSRDLQSK